MNTLVDLLMSRKKRLWADSGLREQWRVDSAPVGSVGAPGGNAPASSIGAGGTGRDPVRNALGLGAWLPGVGGDVLGPLSELRMMAENPETRTAGNAALFLLGLLPAVPPLIAMMNRDVSAPGLARALRDQRGILGTVKIDQGAGAKKVRYGESVTPEELDTLFSDSYQLAEKAAAKAYGVRPSELTQKQLFNHGAGALRAIKVGDKVYLMPAEAGLHEHFSRALKLSPKQIRGMVYED